MKPESDWPVRLTFNTPAIRKYFGDKAIQGVCARIDAAIFIKPVGDEDCEILEMLRFVPRSAHGWQIFIPEASLIAAALQACGDLRRYPFYLIKPHADGWLELIHHKQDEAPRTEPHARAWFHAVLSCDAESRDLIDTCQGHGWMMTSLYALKTKLF